MKLSTGKENYDILDTGTIITFNNEPVTFHLDTNVLVTLTFVTDKDKQDQRMEYFAKNNRELEIVITNFHNSLGTGNAAPLPLATINNRQAYLNFVVYAFNETSNKTVHYTWYLREVVNNG